MRRFASASLAGVAALAFATLGVFALTAPAGATSPPTPSSALTKSAHFAYGQCPARTTILKASIARLTFAKGQPVVVHVTITNTSATACGDVTSTGSTPAPPPSRVVVGQCGQISLVVDNRKGQNIYPGLQVIMCPFIPGPALPAKGSVSATGAWDQLAYPPQHPQPGNAHAVAPGRYKLTIGGQVSFPITITSKVTAHPS
jgi:hypothetical protein